MSKRTASELIEPLTDEQGPIPTFAPARLDEQGRLVMSEAERRARSLAAAGVLKALAKRADQDPAGIENELMQAIDAARPPGQKVVEGLDSRRSDPIRIHPIRSNPIRSNPIQFDLMARIILLDADAIVSAQALLDCGLKDKVTVATHNNRHLGRFLDARQEPGKRSEIDLRLNH